MKNTKKVRLTKEEREARNQKLKDERAAKKAARIAKQEAKKAARLEKIEQKREKKRLAREAAKAKKIAKLEKEKAKKAALREKKRLAKEKAKALEVAKKLKMNKQKNKFTKKDVKKAPVAKDEIDIREASKMMKGALSQIAGQMAGYAVDKRIKKTKAIAGLGYDVTSVDGQIVVKFIVEKTKKDKTTVATNDIEQPNENEPKTIVPDINEPTSVEAVPMGDLMGTDGQVDEAEIANLDNDESDVKNEDDILDADDDTIVDSRDEQDQELIEAREEYFANFSDDGEAKDF